MLAVAVPNGYHYVWGPTAATLTAVSIILAVAVAIALVIYFGNCACRSRWPWEYWAENKENKRSIERKFQLSKLDREYTHIQEMAKIQAASYSAAESLLRINEDN